MACDMAAHGRVVPTIAPAGIVEFSSQTQSML
jgi:hypothetical protein